MRCVKFISKEREMLCLMAFRLHGGHACMHLLATRLFGSFCCALSACKHTHPAPSMGVFMCVFVIS